jgi:YD repeat-containing protein
MLALLLHRYEYQEVTIDYTYDGLYRLTKAEYSTGELFEYSYDATGNRLTQTVTIDEVPVTTAYAYDNANCLTGLDEGEETTYYLYNRQGDRVNGNQMKHTFRPLRLINEARKFLPHSVCGQSPSVNNQRGACDIACIIACQV